MVSGESIDKTEPGSSRLAVVHRQKREQAQLIRSDFGFQASGEGETKALFLQDTFQDRVNPHFDAVAVFDTGVCGDLPGEFGAVGIDVENVVAAVVGLDKAFVVIGIGHLWNTEEHRRHSGHCQ